MPRIWIFEKIAIQDLKNKWSLASDDEINNYLAKNYFYFIYQKTFPVGQGKKFYTIGYEGITLERYVNTLIQKNVHLLVDVRRNPLSKKFGFSKSELSKVLPSVSIEYLHMPELGIASDKRQQLETDRDYEILFKEYENTTLIQQSQKLQILKHLMEEKNTVAITCFEADPWHCHRSRIAQALKADNNFSYKIEHLLTCPHGSHNRP